MFQGVWWWIWPLVEGQEEPWGLLHWPTCLLPTSLSALDPTGPLPVWMSLRTTFGYLTVRARNLSLTGKTGNTSHCITDVYWLF